jgi:hypothetical protein
VLSCGPWPATQRHSSRRARPVLAVPAQLLSGCRRRPKRRCCARSATEQPVSSDETDRRND